MLFRKAANFTSTRNEVGVEEVCNYNVTRNLKVYNSVIYIYNNFLLLIFKNFIGLGKLGNAGGTGECCEWGFGVMRK